MKKFLVACLVAVIALLAFFTREGIYAYATARDEVVTLRNFETKLYPGGEPCLQKYLIFTDRGEFENIDSPWRGKWNSSHIQNELMNLQGKRVVLSYYGWRAPFFSWYPNIYNFHEAPEEVSQYR